MFRTFFRAGIHKFQFPFVGYNQDMGLCSVEAHIGKTEEINKGTEFLFTIIVTQDGEGTPPLEHFIENVTTNLKLWLEQHLTQRIDPKTIRWYQAMPQYYNGNKKVTLQWSEKENCFHTPEWVELTPVHQL